MANGRRKYFYDSEAQHMPWYPRFSENAHPEEYVFLPLDLNLVAVFLMPPDGDELDLSNVSVWYVAERRWEFKNGDGTPEYMPFSKGLNPLGAVINAWNRGTNE